MTAPTDVTDGQMVLTQEGRRLLEARLGHLNRRVIPLGRRAGALVEVARAGAGRGLDIISVLCIVY
jgi:hypothetical protein